MLRGIESRLYYSTCSKDFGLWKVINLIVGPFIGLIFFFLSAFPLTKRIYAEQIAIRKKALMATLGLTEPDKINNKEEIDTSLIIPEGLDLMILLYLLVASILLMLPHLFIHIPYLLYIIKWGFIGIALVLIAVFGIEYYISKYSVTEKERYKPYFKEFAKDSSGKRLRWHIISFAIYLLIIALFAFLVWYSLAWLPKH